MLFRSREQNQRVPLRLCRHLDGCRADIPSSGMDVMSFYHFYHDIHYHARIRSLLAVQRYAGRSRVERDNLHDGRECESKRSKRLPISEATAGKATE